MGSKIPEWGLSRDVWRKRARFETPTHLHPSYASKFSRFCNRAWTCSTFWKMAKEGMSTGIVTTKKGPGTNKTSRLSCRLGIWWSHLITFHVPLILLHAFHKSSAATSWITQVKPTLHQIHYQNGWFCPRWPDQPGKHTQFHPLKKSTTKYQNIPNSPTIYAQHLHPNQITKHHDPRIIPHQILSMACLTAACAAAFRLASAVACAALAACSCAAKGSFCKATATAVENQWNSLGKKWWFNQQWIGLREKSTGNHGFCHQI